METPLVPFAMHSGEVRPKCKIRPFCSRCIGEPVIFIVNVHLLYPRYRNYTVFNLCLLTSVKGTNADSIYLTSFISIDYLMFSLIILV